LKGWEKQLKGNRAVGVSKRKKTYDVVVVKKM